jgi:hypothetical protein
MKAIKRKLITEKDTHHNECFQKPLISTHTKAVNKFVWKDEKIEQGKTVCCMGVCGKCDKM